MTTDFKTVWRDPDLPNRERKQLLAYVIEDVTLLKFAAEGETRIHVRFKGGKTQTLTTQNPKSSAQQVKTRPEVVELVDSLLENHICAEIADILNAKGIRPGDLGTARSSKRAVYRSPRDLPRQALWVALTIRSTAGSGHADKV